MRTIPLHGKKAADRVALVDDADYELVSRYRWHMSHDYATAHIRRADGRWTKITMHNLIMGCVGIDHRNLNGLDNQRSNLRPATQPQNMGNTRAHAGSSSAFKGVSWDRQHQKWLAQISIGGHQHHLGRFLNEEDAARTYDAAAREEFGSFARLNFEESA
jgi:hypothetical protein